MQHRAAWLIGAPFCIAVLLWSAPSRAQPETGHKTLGTIGLESGSQPRPGLYVGDKVFFYTAIRPTTSSIAKAATCRVQHLKLGWRTRQLDLVTGYALYIPGRRVTPGGTDGVGRGHFTHEFSLGTTIAFDAARTWRVSALGSFELNERKLDVDVTRGSTLQIQGGAGTSLSRVVDVGIAAYALWQVSDDRGADLPPALAGARDRAIGLGPEVDVTFAAIGGRLTVRYEHDVAVRSRALGQIFLVGFTVGLLQ
jgi:hypothetical protein